MDRYSFNHRGFIIVLLDSLTGDRISAYADLVSWRDAVAYASDLLQLKEYRNCVLYSITRCIYYENNL